MTTRDKTYSPAGIEARQYARWEEARACACGQADGSPYTIVIPPPNVTGSLHMGHALDNTLQDVLIRWRRMQGRDTLWQPGTDHAGIATQLVAERQPAAQGMAPERAKATPAETAPPTRRTAFPENSETTASRERECEY